jgi:hypothetical protein
VSTDDINRLRLVAIGLLAFFAVAVWMAPAP